MVNTVQGTDAFYTWPAYSVTDAARIARAHPQTVSRWLSGYSGQGRSMRPALSDEPKSASGRPVRVSFLELIEIAVVARYRQGAPGVCPVPLKRLRAAHEYARRELSVDHPFANLRIREEGGHILHDFERLHKGQGTLVLSQNGQYVLPGIVRDELEHADFEGNLPCAWHPYGKEEPIVVNPRVAAGRPTIEGSGVTVTTLRLRVQAGESIDYLAQDYDIAPGKIRRALELPLAA